MSKQHVDTSSPSITITMMVEESRLALMTRIHEELKNREPDTLISQALYVLTAMMHCFEHTFDRLGQMWAMFDCVMCNTVSSLEEFIEPLTDEEVDTAFVDCVCNVQDLHHKVHIEKRRSALLHTLEAALAAAKHDDRRFVISAILELSEKDSDTLDGIQSWERCTDLVLDVEDPNDADYIRFDRFCATQIPLSMVHGPWFEVACDFIRADRVIDLEKAAAA